ncbi:alpha/beta hydrolase [Roseomonas sp. M0104]|uniref:Alpha/beta hydrolase n=1 Tax=Teichococcus coralli TaxID=2545983 RepID=A0A845BN34_9PROT|nr:alpha/beta hydrolase [Pseudoroseomonas coralli]MXP64819.1 alpha/beta hydrolase [Pseudoroseomonas coralli]
MPDALPPHSGKGAAPLLRHLPAAGSPILLFLHGAGCGGWVWEEGFAAHCTAAGLPALVLDFARATKSAAAGLDDYLAQARAVLARQEGPVVLVGHSLGALVAQRLLLEPVVCGAALLAPVPPEGLWFSSARLALTDPALWGEAARMDQPVGTAPADLARNLFSAAMPPARAQYFLRRMGGESRRALLDAQMPQPVPHGWLHRRRVLVLGATGDRLIAPDAVHRCALWHDTRAEFLPGGHLLMLEPGWEGVAGRLLRWVESLGS